MPNPTTSRHGDANLLSTTSADTTDDHQVKAGQIEQAAEVYGRALDLARAAVAQAHRLGAIRIELDALNTLTAAGRTGFRILEDRARAILDRVMSG